MLLWVSPSLGKGGTPSLFFLSSWSVLENFYTWLQSTVNFIFHTHSYKLRTALTPWSLHKRMLQETNLTINSLDKQPSKERLPRQVMTIIWTWVLSLWYNVLSSAHIFISSCDDSLADVGSFNPLVIIGETVSWLSDQPKVATEC